jgi:mycothiol synthase
MLILRASLKQSPPSISNKQKRELTMSFTVRTATINDIPAVIRLIEAAAQYDRTRRPTEGQIQFALTPTNEGNPLNETVLVCNAEGDLLGFLWWDIVNGDRVRLDGWVLPGARRQGVGTALLRGAESQAKIYFKGGFDLAGRGYENIAGFAPLYLSQGYGEARRFYVMSRHLDNGPISQPAPLPNITFSNFQRDDLEQLVEADNAIFADHWGSTARDLNQWQHEMMIARPHNPGLWIIARQENQIVAECLCHTSTEGAADDGWVSIVGVRREWRGRGLGRAVLAQGLFHLQQAGYKTASLHVDANNDAAVNLYRSLEMDAVRTRINFLKSVR